MRSKTKSVSHPQLGLIDYCKRSNQRSIRITIKPDRIRVSLPASVSYARAQRFVASKTDWLLKNQPPKLVAVDGLRIGKSHRLKLEDRRNILVKNQLVRCPDQLDKIRTGIYRALAKEAAQLLPSRIEVLSTKTGLKPKSWRFGKMQSRWGSCSSHGGLSFNSCLMELDWQLIDYVIIHELCHLKHLNHSRQFWLLVASHCPNYQQLRRQLRQHRPQI